MSESCTIVSNSTGVPWLTWDGRLRATAEASESVEWLQQNLVELPYRKRVLEPLRHTRMIILED